MARIAGIDVPRDKRVVISLTYIYGIGKPTAIQVLKDAGVSEDIRVKDLTEDQLNNIRQEVPKLQIEGELRREIQMNVRRLMDIGSYRGIRHRRGMPVRGQNTRNNARTRRGRRTTAARKKK